MNQTWPPKPFPDSYWLSPGKILAGELPLAANPQYTPLKIESLLDAGIRVFINLIAESGFSYEQDLEDVAFRYGVEVRYINIPIKDMDVPSITVMEGILDTIDNNTKVGKAVYYHCYAGLGRTGVVSGCWLARHNRKEGQEILKMLEKIRKEQEHKDFWDSPQSRVQIEMVMNWRYGQ